MVTRCRFVLEADRCKSVYSKDLKEEMEWALTLMLEYKRTPTPPPLPVVLGRWWKEWVLPLMSPISCRLRSLLDSQVSVKEAQWMFSEIIKSRMMVAFWSVPIELTLKRQKLKLLECDGGAWQTLRRFLGLTGLFRHWPLVMGDIIILIALGGGYLG